MIIKDQGVGLMNFRKMRTKYLFFVLLSGCTPEKVSESEMDKKIITNTSVHLKEELKIKSIVRNFTIENNLKRRKSIVIISQINNRKKFIDYFDIEITSYSNENLSIYPDRHCKIDSFLVFFYTEFNAWQDQKVLKSNFYNIVSENNVYLSNDSLFTDNPTWKIKFKGDSIIDFYKPKWP